MRLIDADKVKQYVLTEGFYCDTEADREATAEKIDSLFPTVDAIPIEWLEKWIETIYNDDRISGEEYAYFCCCYLRLKWDWYKENESNI